MSKCLMRRGETKTELEEEYPRPGLDEEIKVPMRRRETTTEREDETQRPQTEEKKQRTQCERRSNDPKWARINHTEMEV